MLHQSWIKRLKRVLQFSHREPRRRSGQRRSVLLFPELLEQRDCPAAFNPNDVLVVNNNMLSEYTTSGSLVQLFNVEYPGGSRPSGENASGVVVGSSGLASIFNGVTSPSLSTLDPTSGLWSHTGLTGDGLSGAPGFGEIGQFQQLIFAPNVSSPGAGIYVIDTFTNSVSSLSTTQAYNNVTVSPGGLVYATEAFASVVDVFDPSTLQQVGSVNITGSPQGLAVDANGDILTADASGVINEYNSAGTLLGSINPNAGALTSIAVAANGQVIAGTSQGSVVFTNEAGSGFVVVPTTSSGTAAYVGFVDPTLAAPPFNSAAAATFTVGSAGSFTVQSFGSPTPTLSETGNLPAGVTFTDNANGTASLSGTPTAGTGGTYSVTITADDGLGDVTTQSFTLTVQEAPSITSASATNFTLGTSGTFTVTTGNCFPAPASLSETGTLPSGVTFTDNGDGTATLTGTPATGSDGSYPITITAHNGVGTDFQQSFTFTVLKKSVTTVSFSPKTEVYGQHLTITAAVAPATGTAALGGTVTFYDNGTALGAPVTVANNHAFFSTTTLGAGTHAITAVYSGGGAYGASVSAAVTETVNAAPTTVYLSTSSLAPRYGQTLTFTAHLVAGGFSTVSPTGTVAFMDGTTTLGTANVSNGYATFATNSLSVGTHPIKAVYTPAGSNNVASSSGVLNETVYKAFVRVALSGTPSPSVAGQEVTLTASVTVVSPASATPSGSVTFNVGTTVLGTASVDNTGVATLTTTSLNAGIQRVFATYNGDGNVTGGSSSLPLLVNQATTSVALSSSPDTILATQPFTLTATVSVASPAVATPTGTVGFFNGSVLLGPPAKISNGIATYVVTQRVAGTYNFTAHYAGNLQCKGSSITQSVVVNPIGQDADAVTVSSNANPSPSNAPVTFTATVTAADPTNGTPTGTVNFYKGTTWIGSATLDSNGVATLTPLTYPASTFSIKATYLGDLTFKATTSAVYSQTVILGTTTSLNVSNLAPFYGQTVTLTAHVNPATTSAVTPVGTISFYDGTTLIDTVNVANKTASTTYQLLSVGTVQLTAVYNSTSTGILGSTSPIFNEPVHIALTQTTFSASSATVVYGQPLTLSATVAVSAGVATPTGTVTFKEGLTVLGTAPVTDGIATLLSPNLNTGTNILTASYNGDSSTGTSNGTGSVKVNAAATTVDLTSTPQYGISGQAFTLTATVNVTDPGAATPTGTVSFFSSVGFVKAVTVTNGVAIYVTPALSAGSYTYTARYNGDSHTAVSPVASTSWQMLLAPTLASVQLSSQPDATVIATANATDPQSLPLTYTYVWSVNGTAFQTDSNLSTATDTLDLSLLGLVSGDTVSVAVTASNVLLSSQTKSQSITVQNPTVTAVNITPDSVSNTTTITAAPTSPADPNGQPITYSYQWFQNGVAISTVATPSAATATLILSQVSGIGSSSVFSVEVTPSDGILTGPAFTSGNVGIASGAGSYEFISPPSISSVTLASANGSDPSGTLSLAHGTTVDATVAATDPQSLSMTYTYQWEVNGTVVQTDTQLSTATDSLDLSTLPGGVVSGDTVTVIVTAYNVVVGSAATTSNTLNVTA